MSALSAHFLTRFSILNIIHPHIKADQHVLCEQFLYLLWPCRISRSPDPRNLVCASVIYSFYSGGWTTHCVRYNGKTWKLSSSHCQFKTCCELGHSVKDTDLISILSCLKVTVFLLISLQLTHWISRYNIDNLWQYFICLDFAVSVILWPCEMRSRL